MLRKRFGAALLSLCLALGLCCPAYAEEAEPSPKAEAQTEAPDDPAGPYALEPARPGELNTAAPRAGNIVDSGTCGRDSGGNLTWTLDSEGTLTISGQGEMADYSSGPVPWNRWCNDILQVVIQEGVTSIGDYAFCQCGRLTSAAIPDGVTSIGSDAFHGCFSLASLTIPDSVTSIGEYAFHACSSLTSVTIPDSVTSIGGCAFGNCSSLASLTIPDSVTSIEASAFYGCTSLAGVTIPDSVTSIGNSAFAYCSELTQITVDSGNNAYISEDGILFNADKTELLCYPAGKQVSSYSVPGGIASIGFGAFSGCGHLTSLVIPDGVISIRNYAFDLCTNLTSVIIPDSVTSIGGSAFENCSSLASLTIPDSVTSIGFYAFRGCSSLASLTIPDSVTSIGFYAFSYCSSLTAVYYGGSEAEWETLLSNSSVEIPETAVVYFNGQRPAPTVPVNHVQSEGSATVHADPEALAAILPASGKTPMVLAAFVSGGAASGAADTSTGEITFQASPKPGDKLYFLDPDTLIPLAKPTELK